MEYPRKKEKIEKENYINTECRAGLGQILFLMKIKLFTSSWQIQTKVPLFFHRRQRCKSWDLLSSPEHSDKTFKYMALTPSGYHNVSSLPSQRFSQCVADSCSSSSFVLLTEISLRDGKTRKMKRMVLSSQLFCECAILQTDPIWDQPVLLWLYLHSRQILISFLVFKNQDCIWWRCFYVQCCFLQLLCTATTVCFWLGKRLV